MYSRDDYLKDCYSVEHSSGLEKTEAAFRKECFENGRTYMISEIFPEYAEKFSSSYGKIHVAGKIYDEKDLYITSNSSVELQNLYDRRSNLLKDFKCSLDILPKLGNPETKLKCYRNLVKLEEQIIAIEEEISNY